MSSADMLKKARGSQYGSSQSPSSETSDVNRSFPLSEDELMGLGEGPMSIRVEGEHKSGTFHVHRLAKIEEGEPEDAKAIDVRTGSEISPG